MECPAQHSPSRQLASQSLSGLPETETVGLSKQRPPPPRQRTHVHPVPSLLFLWISVSCPTSNVSIQALVSQEAAAPRWPGRRRLRWVLTCTLPQVLPPPQKPNYSTTGLHGITSCSPPGVTTNEHHISGLLEIPPNPGTVSQPGEGWGRPREGRGCLLPGRSVKKQENVCLVTWILPAQRYGCTKSCGRHGTALQATAARPGSTTVLGPSQHAEP